VADWADDQAKSVAYLPTADDRGRAAFLRRIMDGFGALPERTFRNYADNRDASSASSSTSTPPAGTPCS
jgi:hypothetical protein